MERLRSHARIPTLWLSFQGRASRTDFWLRYVFLATVLTIAVYVIDTLAGATGMFVNLWQLLLLWPGYAVGVKRYHDRGKSGRAFVFLYSALNVLLIIGVGTSLTIERARLQGQEPASLYVGLFFAATLGLLLLCVYLLIALGVRKGEAGPNRYGPDPLGAPAPPNFQTG